MNKSTFCTDHFALNCKLCSEDEPATLPVSTGEPMVIVSPVSILAVEQLAPQAIAPTQTITHSDESIAVLSVTDQYAKSCDELKVAGDAVKNMEIHIQSLNGMLVELKNDVVTKRARKDDLKRKVLETLAMGGND